MLSTSRARAWTRLVVILGAATIVAAMALPAHAASLTQTWAERYVGGTDFQYASSLAISPDGGTAYVTGISAGPEKAGDPYDVMATIAYDTSNGEIRWLDRFAFAQIDNWASTVVVTPDGQRVFVTGATPDGYPIVAYDAVDGRRLWVKSVMPAGYVGFEGRLAVSPNSRLVYFTGEVKTGTGQTTKLVTRAYNTSTGLKVWGANFVAPTGLQVTPRAMAVDPSGTRVFVTGSMGFLEQYPSPTPPDFVTVAYDATAGSQLWSRTYGGPAGGNDDAHAIVVSPSGTHVYVAGTSGGRDGMPRYTVISYAAATGTSEWVVRDGSSSTFRYLVGMVLDPSGATVFVTGTQTASTDPGASQYRTVAFAATDGAKLWSKGFTGRGDAAANAIAASPDGRFVFVAGSARDGSTITYATVAFQASTGVRVATALYDTPSDQATPEAIGVTPSGTIIVTGRGGGAYATVAYQLTM